MEEMKAAHVAKQSVQHSVADFCNLASAGFTVARNIVGMNDRRR
jgi:hypothetical protein